MEKAKRKEVKQADVGEKVKIFSLRPGDVGLPGGDVLKFQELKDVPAALADYLIKCFPSEIRRI